MFRKPMSPLAADILSGKINLSPVIEDDQVRDRPVAVTMPLLIRLMEWAREDARTDEDIHKVAEKIEIVAGGGIVSMEDWNVLTETKTDGVS